MTNLKIGRVRNGSFTNLTTLTADNSALYTAILRFIDEAGLGDNEIIGFGTDIAQLLYTYLDEIEVRVEDSYVASNARENAKAKVLKTLDQDGTNDPFAILISNRLNALSFEETIEMVDLFNDLYTNAAVADKLFTDHANRSPVGLLSAEARKEYAYNLLNWELDDVRPAVKDVLYKVIEQNDNDSDGLYKGALKHVLAHAKDKVNGNSARDHDTVVEIIELLAGHLKRLES